MHIAGIVSVSDSRSDGPLICGTEYFAKTAAVKIKTGNFCARSGMAGNREMFAGCNVWLKTAAAYRKLTA